MAMMTQDEVLTGRGRAEPVAALDVTKIVVWVAAAAVPWMVIIAAGKLLADALG